MGSANIAFDSIPASIRKPGKYFEFNNKLAVRTLPSNPQRVLVVAQKTAAGSAPANVVVQVFDAETAATLFGRGSQCHRMVKAAIDANRYLQLFVLPVDDAGGSTANTQTITVTGTATGAGSIKVVVGDTEIELNVPSGDAQNTIATALNALMLKFPNLPVAETVATNVVTCTAINKGTVGNALKITASSTVPGVTVAVGAGVTGATDPDLTTPLAAVFAGGHEILVVPYNSATPLQTLRTHLNAVSGPMEQRGAIGVYATGGLLAAATALAAGLNAERITAAFLKNSLTPAEQVAAAYAAVIAFEEDPARPLNTLVLTPVKAVPVADRLSRTEQETLLANGVTPLEVQPGEQVGIVRAITTYTVNAQSVLDISWLDLTTIRTMDFVRLSCRTRISLRFPREKLSERTAARVRSELLDVLIKLEELEIVEAVEANKEGLLVERDLQDPNRLNAKIPTDVVNGLHVFAGRLDLLL